MFEEGDPNLPRGWKVRVNSQGRENFRSPDGQFYHTRQAVLDQLIMDNYPPDQIALVQAKVLKESVRHVVAICKYEHPI